MERLSKIDGSIFAPVLENTDFSFLAIRGTSYQNFDYFNFRD